MRIVQIGGTIYCEHGRVGGYLCPHCPITPDGKSANQLFAGLNKGPLQVIESPTPSSSFDPSLADILQEAIRKLEGLPPGHANWARMLFMIGKGWQRYELSEADASALEGFLRQLRFPRR
jgi:hypothetical protein